MRASWLGPSMSCSHAAIISPALLSYAILVVRRRGRCRPVDVPPVTLSGKRALRGYFESTIRMEKHIKHLALLRRMFTEDEWKRLLADESFTSTSEAPGIPWTTSRGCASLGSRSSIPHEWPVTTHQLTRRNMADHLKQFLSRSWSPALSE